MISETKTLFNACYGWTEGQTDFKSNLQRNGYKERLFGSSLNGKAFVKKVTDSSSDRQLEVQHRKRWCVFLITYVPYREKNLPKLLRSEIGKLFEERGFQYGGLSKVGAPGFAGAKELFTKGERSLLFQGKVNQRDAEITFRFGILEKKP